MDWKSKPALGGTISSIFIVSCPNKGLLVLHIDLGNTNGSDLINAMLKDLTHLHQAFPKATSPKFRDLNSLHIAQIAVPTDRRAAHSLRSHRRTSSHVCTIDLTLKVTLLCRYRARCERSITWWRRVRAQRIPGAQLSGAHPQVEFLTADGSWMMSQTKSGSELSRF